MHTEIHKYTRFGLIKHNGITGYFGDFLGQRLCTYGFPKLGFDNFPISCPKFHWIIPIVMLKFGLYMKKLSEAVKIFKVELRLINNSACYISFSMSYQPNLSIGQNYRPSPGISFVPKWGFRVPMGNHFSFGLAGGIGVFLYEYTEWEPTYGIDLNFGYSF